MTQPSLSAQQAQQLITQLETQVEAVLSFVQVLNKEQALLIQSQTEQLEEVLASKNQLINDIAQNEKSTQLFLSDCGLNLQLTPHTSIITHIVSASGNSELQSIWKRLLACSAEAQEKNRLNGLLINRQLQLTQSTLSVLQPKSNNAGALYGADGQSKISPNSSRGVIAG